MLQAEVGGAKLTPASSYPSRGHVMCDFTLPCTEGKQISLYDYRGHSNLVLFFAGDADHIGEENSSRPLCSTTLKLEIKIRRYCWSWSVPDSKRNEPSIRCNCRFPFWLTKICKSIRHSGHSAPKRPLLPRFM